MPQPSAKSVFIPLGLTVAAATEIGIHKNIRNQTFAITEAKLYDPVVVTL